MMALRNALLVVLALGLAGWLAGCAAPEVKPPPKVEPPPPDPKIVLAAKANSAMERGVKEYEAGNFDESVKELQASLDFGVLPIERQLEARKLMAFSHCLQKRLPLCRAEFRKILEINPNYELRPAEVGHPDWGSVFRTERERVLADLLEERRKQELGRLAPAERLLAEGIHKFDTGEFAAALKFFQDAQKEGLTTREDRLRALKFAAFAHCVENRTRECRAEFMKIFEIEPDFDLTAAESGHPSWGRVFLAAKRDAKATAARNAKRPAGSQPPAKSAPTGPAPATPSSRASSSAASPAAAAPGPTPPKANPAPVPPKAATPPKAGS
jgi:tetratricopeptide (TPR) repeat protein